MGHDLCFRQYIPTFTIKNICQYTTWNKILMYTGNSISIAWRDISYLHIWTVCKNQSWAQGNGWLVTALLFNGVQVKKIMIMSFMRTLMLCDVQWTCHWINKSNYHDKDNRFRITITINSLKLNRWKILSLLPAKTHHYHLFILYKIPCLPIAWVHTSSWLLPLCIMLWLINAHFVHSM